MSEPLEQYWTSQQVADRLHVSLDCVKKWLSRGFLHRTKAGGRTLITESDLQDFIHRSTAKAPFQIARR